MLLMVRSKLFLATASLGALLGISFGCAHDTYQQRADIVKDHVEAFYSHLKTNHVEAAVRENEQIEAMAGQMGETVRKRAQLQGTTQVEREFALMKTANEAAAQNWLALGQYFSIKKQHAQARATYQENCRHLYQPYRPFIPRAGSTCAEGPRDFVPVHDNDSLASSAQIETMRWTYRFLPHTRLLIAGWLCTLLLLLTALPGCVRRIEVHPVPSHPASSSIPRSPQSGNQQLDDTRRRFYAGHHAAGVAHCGSLPRHNEDSHPQPRHLRICVRRACRSGHEIDRQTINDRTGALRLPCPPPGRYGYSDRADQVL